MDWFKQNLKKKKNVQMKECRAKGCGIKAKNSENSRNKSSSSNLFNQLRYIL